MCRLWLLTSCCQTSWPGEAAHSAMPARDSPYIHQYTQPPPQLTNSPGHHTNTNHRSSGDKLTERVSTSVVMYTDVLILFSNETTALTIHIQTSSAQHSLSLTLTLSFSHTHTHTHTHRSHNTHPMFHTRIMQL